MNYLKLGFEACLWKPILCVASSSHTAQTFQLQILLLFKSSSDWRERLCFAFLLTLFQISQFQHLFQFLKDILWSCRNSRTQGKTLPESFYSILVSTPGTFCCHVVGDLPTSEASILPRTELELELLQIQEYMRVSYPAFQREIQIMKISIRPLQTVIEGICSLLRTCCESCWFVRFETYFIYHFWESEFANWSLKQKRTDEQSDTNGHGEMLHSTAGLRCICRAEVSV